jgi:hypothetical protein
VAEDLAEKEEFWARKKQEWRATHAGKWRKKAWIEANFDNPNTELNDEDPRWLDYTIHTSEESTDEE